MMLFPGCRMQALRVKMTTPPPPQKCGLHTAAADNLGSSGWRTGLLAVITQLVTVISLVSLVM